MSLDTTRQRLRSYGGIPGLSYIIEEFIPFMRKNGISETDIRRFFVENPAQIFSYI
jgi:phosphotriesterase-related protein